MQLFFSTRKVTAWDRRGSAPKLQGSSLHVHIPPSKEWGSYPHSPVPLLHGLRPQDAPSMPLTPPPSPYPPSSPSTALVPSSVTMPPSDCPNPSQSVSFLPGRPPQCHPRTHPKEHTLSLPFSKTPSGVLLMRSLPKSGSSFSHGTHLFCPSHTSCILATL